MRTSCPVCGTVFRVTSEQLRLKAGKVRCGQCQAVFNAFDSLIEESSLETVQVEDQARMPEIPVASEPPDEPVVVSTQESSLDTPMAPEPEAVEPTAESLEVVAPIEMQEPLETIEKSTMAAREAGLVAARELSEVRGAGHERWAAGTLAGNGLSGLELDPPRRALWPFVLVALLLLVAQLGQLIFHFRTEIVQRMPSATVLYELAAVDLPLPQNSEMVAIEASDLQSDNSRDLFVLQATLRNRASYAQAWPALELTLTDTSDTVVARRVLRANDYLPPATDPNAFPANGEVAVKLWIEAKDIGAAGYRLYIFYP